MKHRRPHTAPAHRPRNIDHTRESCRHRGPPILRRQWRCGTAAKTAADRERPTAATLSFGRGRAVPACRAAGCCGFTLVLLAQGKRRSRCWSRWLGGACVLGDRQREKHAARTAVDSAAVPVLSTRRGEGTARQRTAAHGSGGPLDVGGRPASGAVAAAGPACWGDRGDKHAMRTASCTARRCSRRPHAEGNNSATQERGKPQRRSHE